MRPGKLRFVALMHFKGVFMRPNVSTGPPRQAAQPAFSVICTPASTRDLPDSFFTPARALQIVDNFRSRGHSKGINRHMLAPQDAGELKEIAGLATGA